MARPFLTNPTRPRRFGWLKVLACVAVTGLLAAGFWFRWIPGRPVSPEWARGGATPDNAFTYETEDDLPTSRAPDADALHAPDFLFTMGEGSGMTGYDVIQVWPDGKCEYSYPVAHTTFSGPGSLTAGPAYAPSTSSASSTQPATGPAAAASAGLTPWQRATFHVDPATVADLRQLLVNVGYFDMKKSYYAPDVHDGTQWFVRARAGGREKAVSCNNYFPDKAIRLNDFVRTRIVAPNRAAVAGATPVSLPANWLPNP